MSDRRTWSLDEFQGGIDLRDGLFSANQTRFRELQNLWIDKGRKLRRRPPCLQVDGELSAACQGLVSIDGQLYTFAKQGDTVTHTGDVAGLVQTLSFTNPDHCTDWELITAGIFDGYAAAWILHTYPSTAYPKVAMLHVWDGLIYAPTFVQDPYLPGSFSPSIADLTDQRYSATFRPVQGQGVSKLWSSTLRGNAHCCRTADARVWNQRSKDSFLTDGEHWCFIVPEGSGNTWDFIVPRNADWMSPDQRWAYYVLEYDDNGTWTPMAEVTGAPASPWEWSWSAVPSRFAGGWDEVQISVQWGRATAGLIRLRLVAGATSLEIVTEPTVSTTSAGSGTWDVICTAGRYRYRGGDAQDIAVFTAGQVTEGRSYLVGMSADETNFPSLIDITNQFPSGWTREHLCFYKKITIKSGGSPVIEDYQYAYESDDDSAWYTELLDEYVDLAGAEDALSISTAAHDNTGGTITSISSLRNRMLITYAGSMQLWSIDQDTNRTAYLDALSFGTGSQETPQPVPWYTAIITPVETGYRAISVVGANTDNLQDLNVGEPIAPLPELSALAAQFWPWFGQVIIAGTTDDGLEFRCLDYSRESKITAWSQWTVAGLTAVDVGTMIPAQDRLWFRSGAHLHYFDASATIFRDFADVEGSAYESAATFHFNDMGKPGQSKRIVAMDIVQDGTCSMGFRLPPYGASFAAVTDGPDLVGPTIEGITYGRSRFPLAMVATAVAPRITTRDETGWRLQRIALDFLLLRR